MGRADVVPKLFKRSRPIYQKVSRLTVSVRSQGFDYKGEGLCGPPLVDPQGRLQAENARLVEQTRIAGRSGFPEGEGARKGFVGLLQPAVHAFGVSQVNACI